jgi:predicted ATPase/class 3 adenylate cyclase
MRTEVDSRRLPTGTVTFMFTDIEGSTLVVQRLGNERFAELLEEHNRLVREAIVYCEGIEVSTDGDSLFAVFVDPLSAVRAAIRIQNNLMTATWDHDEPILVRIGLHSGSGVLGGDNYVGIDVHKASRISAAAHGGQIVMSDVTAGLVGERLPGELRTRPLGRYRLSGFAEEATLHQLTAEGLKDHFPPLRARAVESQLPMPLTEFVGRGDDIDLGLQLLGRSRLLTLTGPGGTGKTRLSLEIARQAETDFPDGAHFVPLASLTDPSLIAMAVVDAVHLKTAGGIDPLEHLIRFMADRRMLLVLDNFEQLLPGATIVADLLARASGLSVIATSRSPLRIAGERELPVPPLEVPAHDVDVSTAADAEGIQLFVKRAEAVRPDFDLTAENVAAVAAIVRTLDGLPLAIELAASRLRSLTPDLVLDRLGNQLLKSQSSDLPARQQTIVNAISWSYDLLDEEYKLLFEKLSVFSGTFGVDEVEVVCGDGPDPLDGVTELTEQSLLRQSASAGQPRFRMLTVIREFAYGALVARGLDRDLLDRHAAVFSDLAERADDVILTSNQGYWLERLSVEHENLRGAFDHSVDSGDSRTALRLAGTLWRFWQIRGYLFEGQQRLETALGMPATGLDVERAKALSGLGGILYWQGKWHEILAPYQEAVDLLRQHGSDQDLSEALYNLSFAVGYVGDPVEAEALLHESLELSEHTGRQIGVGRAHWGLGNLAVYTEDWEFAVDEFNLAVDEFSSIDAPFDLAWAWFMLAYCHVKVGEPASASTPLRKSLEIFAAVADVSALALILELLAFLVLPNDQRTTAYFLGAVSRLKVETGIGIGDIEFNQYTELVEFVEDMDEVSQAGYDEGYSADLETVVDAAEAFLDRASSSSMPERT